MRVFVTILWSLCVARRSRGSVDTKEYVKHYATDSNVNVYCNWERISEAQSSWPKPTVRSLQFSEFATKIDAAMHENIRKYAHSAKNQRGSWWTWQEDNVRHFCDAAFCKATEEEAAKARGFKKVMGGNTLHLCYTIYQEKICDEMEKGEQNGGALSLRCFLHKAYRGDVPVPKETPFLRQLRDIRVDVRTKHNSKHTTCENLDIQGTDGFCDVGEEIEKNVIDQLPKRISMWNRKECEEPRAAPSLKTFHVFGPPETSPPWMTLECTEEPAENEMWVKLNARRHRVMYLQLWFIKFERDLYEGDDRWFYDALQATDKAMHTVISTWKRRRKRWLNPDRETVKEEYRRVVPDSVVAEREDAGRFISSDTWQALAAWNFVGVPSKGTEAEWRSPDTTWPIPKMLIDHGVEEMQANSDPQLPHPELVARTRFRKYLLAPELWNREFWDQIAPIHYARYHAQEVETKHSCKYLGLDPEFYRHPYFKQTSALQQWSRETSKKSWLESDLKTESSVDANSCSIPLIHARMAALNSVTATAVNDAMSDEEMKKAYAHEEVHTTTPGDNLGSLGPQPVKGR